MDVSVRNNKAIGIITWLLRFLFGVTFVFSGFVKSIDPWGTLYKVNDYLAVLGLDLWPNLRITAVFALCAVEFFVGVMILTGCFRRSAPVLGVVIMAFMLPFSLWIAMTDPVADCGCFGDAFVISNWATFWKNVVLTILAVWLCRYNRSCRCLVTPALQWIAFVVTAVFIVAIELFGYVSQPLLDFRAYKEGSRLVEEESSDDEEPSFVFIYEKDGERREIGENDELPDESDGWKFVERKEIGDAAKKEETAGMGEYKSFRIWSRDGDEDVTEEVMAPEGRQLLVMIPDLSDTSISNSWKLNSMSSWASRNDIDMIAVVAGSKKEIDEWEDLSMISYPVYTADDTAIKEVVRGNPGVVYLRDGIIEWKSTLRALNVDDFMAPETSADPMSFRRDNRMILRNVSCLYLSIMAVLMVLSLLPSLSNMYWRRRDKEGKAETLPEDSKD